jgi:thiol-disulfide isomerase/thioredoxin
MKKILMTVVLCLILCTAHGQEQPKPAFKVAPQYPTPGGEVTLTYDNSVTELAKSSQITGVIYICNGNYWWADDLQMNFSDGQWTARYTLPNDCLMFACKFHGDDGKWDSGDNLNSYGMFAYKVEGERVSVQPRTFLNRALIGSALFDRLAVPGYLKDKYKTDEKNTQNWIMKESLSFPQSMEETLYFYCKLKEQTERENTAKSFRSDLEVLLKSETVSELSLIRAVELCRTLLGDTAQVNRIERIILERWPDGMLARDRQILKIHSGNDEAAKIGYLNQLIERFPQEKFPVPQTVMANAYYPVIFWGAFRNNPDQFYNEQNLRHYAPLAPFSGLCEMFYRGIGLPFKKQLKKAPELLPYAEILYAEIARRIDGISDRYSTEKVLSPMEWHRYALNHAAGNAVSYARLLIECGNPEQALSVLEPLKTLLEDKISEYNDLYTQALIDSKQTTRVVPFIERCIKVDAATPEMISVLKADFGKNNLDGDFNQHLNSLRSKEYVARMEEELLGQIMHRPVEAFNLEDASGHRVNMADLKGNVIVLDFWATWCVPCNAALPGMQMAVDRFKDNSKVKFYFISTMEQINEKDFNEVKKQIPERLAKRGLHLDMLFDDFNEKGQHGVMFGKYAKEFGMSGIPQKMIIDPEGYVRWVSGGYKGNPLELANEITFMVNYLLEEASKK